MQVVVKNLSEKIGLADTIELVRRWGGRDLAVPVKVAAADPLALTLGLDSARRLVEHFGGVRLQLPAERNALLDLRNAAIFKACVIEGRSQESVGLEFGLTRQGVKTVVRAMKERAGGTVCGAPNSAEVATIRD